MPESVFSRLHGLIIGINTYKNKGHDDLRGCVSDATSLLDYFTKDLEVPLDHFRCLFNEEATRDNIINTFCSHLIENPNIQPLEPIVVYFSGHGARGSAIVERDLVEAKEKIELIATYDANTVNSSGEYIWGIPDKTLGALIHRLSRVKGNNITVILDCCHSGSGTRGGNARVRSSQISDAPPMPSNLDEHRIRGELTRYPMNLQRSLSLKALSPSLDTHTLLAACRDEEQACEIAGMGIFTYALLQALKQHHPSALTYSTLSRIALDFVTSIKLPEDAGGLRQTPQCEGQNQDRFLFSTRAYKIPLIPTNNTGIFRIEAGNAVGIVRGTEFGVFSDTMGSANTPIAQLVATDVGPNVSLLKELHGNTHSILELLPNVYVDVIKYNNHSSAVRISAIERSTCSEPWQEVFRNLETQPVPIIWVEPGEPSDLTLVLKNNGVELQRNLGAQGRPGPAHILLQHGWGANRLTGILTAVIQFHYHLQHQIPGAPLQAQLEVKLQELETRQRRGDVGHTPMGKDLFQGCLANGAIVNVQANPQKLFGLTLVNKSNQDLFPYVLYYNLEDYSVSCLYDPPSRWMKAPLLAHGSLFIGSGQEDSSALNVELTNPASEKEYGMFVFLVCNEWVDIAGMKQDSPFEVENDTPRSTRSEDKVTELGVWDKLVIPISISP